MLTFFEMTRLYWAIIFYVHLESGVFLLMYKYQDRIGPNNVFNPIHILYAVFDFSLLVCVRPTKAITIISSVKGDASNWDTLQELHRPP